MASIVGYGRQGPTKAAEKSDRKAKGRGTQNQAFLAPWGLGAAQSPQKSPTRRAPPRADAAGRAEVGARAPQAVQPGQYAPPPQRRSEAEIEEEREERAAERLAKFLKGRTRPQRRRPPTPGNTCASQSSSWSGPRRGRGGFVI